MPRTGPTLCHPKNWLCGSERNSALDYVETTQTLPQIPDTKLHGDSKHNPSHVQQHTLPPQHLATPILSPTLTSLNSTSLAAPKANHIPCCK